jgi:hypothetical protein
MNLSGTIIALLYATTPPAEYEVQIHNNMSNGPHDDGVYTLHLDGVDVPFRFHWEYGPDGEDAVIVDPPPGYICDPIDCTAVVPELGRGVVYLIPYMGF